MERVPRLWRKTASRDPDAELRDLQDRFRSIRAKASNRKPQVAEPVALNSECVPAEAPVEDATTTGPWSTPPTHAATIPNKVFRHHSTSSSSANTSLPLRGLVFATVLGGVVGFAVVALAVTFGD